MNSRPVVQSSERSLEAARAAGLLETGGIAPAVVALQKLRRGVNRFFFSERELERENVNFHLPQSTQYGHYGQPQRKRCCGGQFERNCKSNCMSPASLSIAQAWKYGGFGESS